MVRRLVLLLLALPLAAQIPYDQIPAEYREEVRQVVTKADFHFATRTEPKQVRVATLEKIFDHPRVGVALWRYCRFAPTFFAFTHGDGSWTVDDAQGLRGTMHLVYRRPGHRIYLVYGVAEPGRVNALSPRVKARMLTSYRYWDGPKGFESHLESWTELDSAVLGFFAKPFRGVLRRKQDQFIAYINGNVAAFGEFAEADPAEYRRALQSEGDLDALRDFERLFRRNGH